MSERHAMIVGWAHSQFGKSEDPDTESLMARVSGAAMTHAGVEANAIDGIYVGVMNNGFSKQDFQAGLVALGDERLAHTPATRLENACATGSAALYAAMDFIESGRGEIALVVGAEKMTGVTTAETGEILLGACYRKEEADVEGGFAGIFGRLAQSYFQRYGDRSEDLARIAAKNHANGMANPYAHMRKAFDVQFCNTPSDKNPFVAGPLRRTDCSLVSDGAAAIVVASEEVAQSLDRAIGFRARRHVNDFLPLSRRDPIAFEGARRAWRAALDDAGHHGWSLAMQLKHRCGARWGELIALRPVDLEFGERRVVRIHRAVEQSRQGFAIKTTKNRQRRVSTFPASLVEPLRGWSDDVERQRGPEGLLFPGPDGGFANRRAFQRTWARAANDAGWPMKRPTAALWHPHDLRHVAACWLLFDVGLDPAVVSNLLGHANAAFTLSRYVGVRGDLSATVTAATEAW